MAIYAQLQDNTVVNVIQAEPDFIESGVVGDPANWINMADCKNTPGVGSTYDAELQAFIHPQPWPNWVVDTHSYEWVPPVPKPAGDWFWDQHATRWIAERGPFSQG